MRIRKLAVSFMICALIFSCTTTFSEAAEVPNETVISPRVSSSLDHQISANTITPIDGWFYASSGDTVQYNCTYTPATASVDFGFITPDGLFYSVNCTSGKINRALKIEQAGQHILAIRNNASYDIVVNGTIKY